MRTRSGAGGDSPDAEDDFSEEITDDGPPPPQNVMSDMDPALEEQVLETNVDVVIDSSAFQAAVDREVARVLRQRERMMRRLMPLMGQSTLLYGRICRCAISPTLEPYQLGRIHPL